MSAYIPMTLLVLWLRLWIVIINEIGACVKIVDVKICMQTVLEINHLNRAQCWLYDIQVHFRSVTMHDIPEFKE